MFHSDCINLDWQAKYFYLKKSKYTFKFCGLNIIRSNVKFSADFWRLKYCNMLEVLFVLHIINMRHKGRQMSSLYFWVILHSISAVAEELFWAEWQSIKYMSKIFFLHMSWWSSVRVQSQLSEGLRFKFHRISMSLFLKLCLTITPPSPSSCIK